MGPLSKWLSEAASEAGSGSQITDVVEPDRKNDKSLITIAAKIGSDTPRNRDDTFEYSLYPFTCHLPMRVIE